jgi:hypothetical protein
VMRNDIKMCWMCAYRRLRMPHPQHAYCEVLNCDCEHTFSSAYTVNDLVFCVAVNDCTLFCTHNIPGDNLRFVHRSCIDGTVLLGV